MFLFETTNFSVVDGSREAHNSAFSSLARTLAVHLYQDSFYALLSPPFPLPSKLSASAASARPHPIHWKTWAFHVERHAISGGVPDLSGRSPIPRSGSPEISGRPSEPPSERLRGGGSGAAAAGPQVPQAARRGGLDRRPLRRRVRPGSSGFVGFWCSASSRGAWQWWCGKK